MRVISEGWQSSDDKDEEDEREPSQEMFDRKARSTAKLIAAGVSTLESLPLIEDSSEALIRTAEEIAQRAVAVCLVAAKGEGLEQEILETVLKEYAADAFFSPEETAFIRNLQPSDREKIQFSWRYEALWVLLWTLGYIPALGDPVAACDVGQAVELVRSHGPARLASEAVPRGIDEILDEADYIYRAHWAVIHARRKQQSPPGGFHSGVVYERHYALNWLIGYQGQDWDDITTDT